MHTFLPNNNKKVMLIQIQIVIYLEIQIVMYLEIQLVMYLEIQIVMYLEIQSGAPLERWLVRERGLIIISLKANQSRN